MNYRSRFTFLGLPLLHVATGGLVDGRYRRGVAVAWLAVGDVALGVLLGVGGVSIGGIALGGVSIGLVPIGGLALGVLALGGLAAGVIAIGGAAFGGYAAMGGLAVAREYAMGGYASARHVLAPPAHSLPVQPIPHPPFEWTDAFLLVVILLVLLLVLALRLQGPRER